ncbi:MAG: GAF domain-containing protein [Lachnospiraceae bacterium]|nr:GAF domain-containing protein [Lachnospiraceae bacterium]
MKVTEDLKRILDIAMNLTVEQSYERLLDSIISESMEIADCDAGTLYILEDNALRFMIMRNKSMNVYEGGNGEPIASMPPVEMDGKSVSSYVALNKKPINIKDVYEDESFDWQGPKRYDSITGYRTRSMLVVPLINHDNKVIGVLQLLNAKDADGNPHYFDDDDEQIIFAIASEAAVSLSNMMMYKQLSNMLNSFVASMTAAIDARTPYNAHHTVNVARYCDIFTDYLNEQYKAGKTAYSVSEEIKEQLIMAAMLHDVGKLITPEDIMNKPDRLDRRLPLMEERWRLMRQILRCDMLLGKMTKEEHSEALKSFEGYCDRVREYNCAGFLSEEKLDDIRHMSEFALMDDAGDRVEFISAEELNELMISKGTLTAEERGIIEKHVVFTDRILSEISFGDKYSHVRFIAGAHHEFLDGSGYPNRLKEEELPVEVRILTIMDIYDSLTADDRPYKKAVPKDRAVGILATMAAEGKLDSELVRLTAECMNIEEK